MSFIRNKWFIKILKIGLWGFSLVFGSIFIATSSLVLFLASGPVNLTPYKVYGDHVLSRYLPKSQLKFKAATLRWDSERLSFILQADDVKIKSNVSMSKLVVPTMAAYFPAYRILFLNFRPTILQIDSPQFKLYDSFGSPAETDEEEKTANILEALEELTQPTSAGKVIITNAEVRIKSHVFGHWKLSHFKLVLQRIQGVVESGFTVNVKKVGPLSGVFYSREGKPLKLKLAFKDFNLQQVVQRSGMTRAPFIKDIKSYLKYIHFPLSGEVAFYLTPPFNLEEIKFHLGCGQGDVSWPGGPSKPIPLKNGTLKGSIQEDKVHLETMSLLTPYGEVGIKGDLSFKPNIKAPSEVILDMEGETQNLNFKAAPILWPEGVAQVPREWIIQNIPTGAIPKATAAFKGAYSVETGSMRIDSLKGEILPKDSVVHYLEGLDPVVGVSAQATYDKDAMTIKLLSGHVHGQHIKQGTITIRDLQKEDQWMDIELDVEGPAQDALKIINVPRLQYGQKYGLLAQNTKGTCSTHLDFSFPLERATTLEKVDLNVISRLGNAQIKNILEKIPLHMTQGNLLLKLTKEKMDIQGTCLLNESPADIQWVENFDDKKASLRSNLVVKGVLSNATFKSMEASFDPYFLGSASYTVALTQSFGEIGSVDMKVDLGKALLQIPELKAIKPVGKTGILQMAMELKKGKPSQIKSLTLEAGSALRFQSHAQFDPVSGHLSQLMVETLQVGQNSYKGSLVRGDNALYTVMLAGSYIDLTRFIEHKDDIDDGFLSKFPYKATLDIGRADVKGSPFLESVKATFDQSASGVLQKLDLTAMLPEHKGKKGACEIHISPQGDTQEMTVKIDNLGQPLSALSSSTDLKGGVTHITAKRSLKDIKPGNWDGHYKVTNFQIKNAPVLARLLKIASPLAFVEIFSKGKGLTFADLQGGFVLKPDVIVLKNGRATGPSIGMTLEGYIYRKNDTLDLRGSLIPAYFLNSIMSYIPLIGPLIAGGKGEGIVVISFTIKGSQDNPEVSANPLSAMAPGILRKMFEGPMREKE